MSDETTLLPCPFCGSEARMLGTKERWFNPACSNSECGCEWTDSYVTEAEAIAAWNTRAAKTIGKVQVEIEPVLHGTLTAEQAEKIVDRNCEWYEGGEIDAQAIADELGSGTCKITATATNNLMYPDYMTKWYELSCGHSLTLKGDEAPKWCAVCGKAVER